MHQPRVVEAESRNLVGMRAEMSLSEDRTSELWRSFRPKMHEIDQRIGTDAFSVHIFEPGLSFADVHPTVVFTKWAAVEAGVDNVVPAGMECMVLPGGLYAVFIHKGTPQMAHRTFGFIFGEWLPASGYVMDDRPQFEMLGESYDPFDPSSEEEIWLPIRRET